MVKTAVDKSLRPKIKPDDVVPIGKPVAKLSDQMAAMVTGRDKTDDGQPIMSPQIRRDIATPTDFLLQKAEDYIEDVNQTENPIQAVLYANMLTRGKMIGNTGIQIPGLNLDENIKEHRDAIIGFFKNAVGREDYDPRDIAWCAAFVDATLTKIGADRLNPGVKLGSEKSYARVRAREYVNYGEAIELSDIKEGDLIVLDFDPPGTPGHGIGDHVGFYPGDRAGGFPTGKDEIKMLGGNQGGMGATIERSSEGEFTQGAVSIKNFDLENVLSVRRITRDSKPWEGVKDENPLFFYEKKGTPGYGMQEGGLTEQQQTKTLFGPRVKAALPKFGKFMAEATPIIGDAIAAEEVYKELQKDDPNYYLAGALGGAAILGLIPGIGDAVANAIKAGARKALDVGKRIEVDPNALGVMGGNVRLKPPVEEVTPQVSNIDYQKKMAEFDKAETADDWQNTVSGYVTESRDVNPTVRTPELEASAKDLLDGKITREQHLENVDKYKPVEAWDALPREPSSKATVFSLNTAQRKDGNFILPDKAIKNLNVKKSNLKVGDRFLGRLDIPAYKAFDTWIIAGKSPKGDAGTTYAKAIHYEGSDGKPVIFRASQGKGEKIGMGKADPAYTKATHEKTGYATVDGMVKDLDVEEIRDKAAKYLNDPDWTQVGFDPRRQGGFYVRNQKNKHVPVREADEVIQIGPLVLAKNAKLDLKHKGFNEGGVAMNRQMKMAFMQQGGLKDDGMKVDPVSGNQIPPGSMAKEVRDDIPAQLSEGEYVVPADVVQYYGVKHFEDLRNKAKGGLGQMERDGRIGGEPVPVGGPKAGQPPMTQAPMPPAPKQMAMGGPLSGEEMQELQRMANGGMVQMADPYQQQKSMYQQPQGMSLGGSPFMPNIGTGFSWEATGPGSITPTKPEIETPASCEAKGKVYDPTTGTCVDAPPVTPMFTSSRDRTEPPKVDPNAWMKNYNYGDLDALRQQTADTIAAGSNLPGLFGVADRGQNLANSAAHIIILSAQGRTEEAKQLQTEWEKQRTGILKIAPIEIIDGDRKAIQAAGAYGIKLDRDMINPIDNKPLFRNDKDYERYKANYEVSVKNKKTTTTKDGGKQKPSLAERLQKDRGMSATERAKVVKETTVSSSSPEGVTITGQQQTAGADVGSGVGGTNLSGPFNKGGLMQRKKVNKK